MFGSTMRAPGRVSLVRVGSAEPAATLADDVHMGLSVRRKRLSCRFFYDAEGSRLFEQICDLPEYYPTRTEDAILREHADASVDGFDEPPVLIELGSGSSTKTRRLIEALLRRYGRLRYVPIDISPTILEEAAADLARRYPTLRITAIVGEYRPALRQVARRIEGPKLVTFLGSSIGNSDREEAIELLRVIRLATGQDGKLLLGADLVKEPGILEAAYDDAQGVTARFNLNLLARINRELDAEFDLEHFAHRAVYNEQRRRIEMHLVSRRSQSVSIPGASLLARFADGESIHTENSHKYRVADLQDLASEAGFREEAAWTDARGWFRVQRWESIGG